MISLGEFFLTDPQLEREASSLTKHHKRRIGFLIYRDFRALQRPITLEPYRSSVTSFKPGSYAQAFREHSINSRAQSCPYSKKKTSHEWLAIVVEVLATFLSRMSAKDICHSRLPTEVASR